MTIKDYAGNKLTKPEEWQKPTGRLIQSKDEVDTLIFATWDEVPAREEETAPSKEPTIADQITDMQMALADLYEEKNNG